MPDWFTPVVVILALIELALLVAFWTMRNRKYAAAMLAVGAAFVAVWLIARFLPTDRKAIESAIDDMAAGVKNRNPNQIFAHLAKDFRFRSLDKDAFQRLAESHVRGGTVDEVRILSYEKFDIRKGEKKADVEFQVKPFGRATGETLYYLCRARFVLEADDKWRMQTFELYNPFVESNRAIDIPGVN